LRQPNKTKQNKKIIVSNSEKENTFRIQQREMVNKHKRELNGNSLFSGFCLNLLTKHQANKEKMIIATVI